MKVHFTKEQATEHIYRIRGIGDACMYYIHGDNSGLLVDTGYGVGDLRSFIDKTFDQPYEVFITHGHADHANGIEQWKEVYLNRLDRDLYYTKTAISLRRIMLKRTVPDIDEYPDTEFQRQFTGVFKDIEDGMIFDLGNCTVQTIGAPGHTQGMMVLLVKEDRAALFGDACGVCTFLFKPESSTVAEYCRTLQKLQSYEDCFDIVLRQHGTCSSPKSITEENLDTAKKIIAGTDAHLPFDYLGEHVWMAEPYDPATGMRKDGKSGNIVYSMDKIR
jgi:glyoxylase-like metal-dependent hydrolase (beta-lactamase superfamily II)